MIDTKKTSQEFTIAQFCYVCKIDNNNQIEQVVFHPALVQCFIDFSEKIQSIKKDNKGKMDVNDFKKLVIKFNKEFVKLMDILPKMVKQKADVNVKIVDILAKAFVEGQKSESNYSVGMYGSIPITKFANSFFQITRCLQKVDLDKDLATGPFRTIMLYLIQPICQILKKQEWAKNLIAEKESIKSVTHEFKTFAELIYDTETQRWNLQR